MNSSTGQPFSPSDSLWRLAWKRLCADRVAMVSLAVVLLFIGMLLLSLVGLIAADWEKEAGVHYAPPHFVGAEKAAPKEARKEASATGLAAIEAWGQCCPHVYVLLWDS